LFSGNRSDKYLDHHVFDVIEWIFVVLAAIFLIWWNTPAEAFQKSIEGSDTGRSTIHRKRDGSMNENAKILFGKSSATKTRRHKVQI
jgi:hypothetical protein